MKHRISGSVLIRGSRSGRAGGLTTVTQPSLPTETYTWWADGTLKSLPGTGVTRNLDYNENGQLTSISHNTTAKFEFAYAYDGARRSSKDLTSGVWTWFPCGVQCSAGELVTLTSTNSGGSWATSSTNLAAASCGGGVVRSGTDFILRDLFGNVAETRNASNTVVATAVFDAFGVQRFGTGTLSAGVLRNTYGDNNEDGMSAFLRGRASSLARLSSLPPLPEAICHNNLLVCLGAAALAYRVCLSHVLQSVGKCMAQCVGVCAFFPPACKACAARCAVSSVQSLVQWHLSRRNRPAMKGTAVACRTLAEGSTHGPFLLKTFSGSDLVQLGLISGPAT